MHPRGYHGGTPPANLPSIALRPNCNVTRQRCGAGLTLPWSTGTVEGHIHRLKLIKRQMYGRAKLDLLRIRALHAA